MPQALQIADQVCVVAFASLAMMAAYSDWFRFIIPNRVSLAIAGLWVVHAALLVLQHHPITSIAWSAGIALTVFVVGFGLFAANLLGGGDVKLLAAAALWVPADFVAHFIMIVTVSGAVLGLLFLVPWIGNHPGDGSASAPASMVAVGRIKRKMPYGVAIGAGCGAVALKLLNVLPIGG